MSEMRDLSELRDLHRRLSRLHRRRVTIRWATAASAALAAALCLLTGIFLIDVLFETDVPQRLFLIAVAGAVFGWAVHRFAWPFWKIRESRIALALQVERRERIDSDLVAAMQFEGGSAAGSGSPALQHAVVGQAVRLARQHPLEPGPAVPQARRVFCWTLLGVAAVAGICWTWPEHARVFTRRLCLASPHYPTRSTIEVIELAGTRVLERSRHGTQPRDITRPEGTTVLFRVWATGRLPDAARVELTSEDRRRRVVPLKRLPTGSPGADADSGGPGQPAGDGRGGCYAGRLPRLLEPARFQVFVGDAWSDPARLGMVPLPAVALNLRPVLPEYARGAAADAADAERRQVAVLEGSDVRLSVRCTNGKRLRAAWITIVRRDPPERFDLTPDPAGTWSLAEGGSPFSGITREIRFRLQVRDEDGLSLEAPLAGSIRIQPDRPPTCSASLVHRVVLPTATPVIEYRAGDDFALDSVRLEAQWEPAGGSGSGVLPTFSLPIRGEPGPWTTDRLPLGGRYRLQLARLGETGAAAGSPPPVLAKGDRLKLTVVARDFRGDRLGETTRSEPLVLEISDESGVLSAISESDEQSEQRLSELIKQQLGIGDE